MTAAMEQVQALAQRNGATRIHRIRMRVGALSGVVPEALEFAFETLKSGTPAAEATLEIERVPAIFHCAGCGKDLPLESVEFDCPECGGPLTLAGGGRELELADMEIS
ncbi:MAG: hydrogenase maturation nickel metallochaperone HypA [Verrucomicrobiae bacterium]|nr:hydrogenase maturation nickel metallochaperone HypA [Verrucomicrobiae bacterium]